MGFPSSLGTNGTLFAGTVKDRNYIFITRILLYKSFFVKE